MKSFRGPGKHLTLAVLVATVLVLFTGPSAAAAPFYYFYVITAPPNWAQGNPQPLASWSALTATGPGAPTAPENYVSLTLLNGASGYAYDTFRGESFNILGADVSIPTAQWINPVGYWWVGGPGPVNGGALLFFNSFNAFTGLFYANELIIGDPAGCNGLCELDAFENSLGISNSINSLVTGPGSVTPPSDDDSLLTTPDDYVDFTPSPAPEGPTAIYLMLGMFAIAAGVFLRRRLILG